MYFLSGRVTSPTVITKYFISLKFNYFRGKKLTGMWEKETHSSEADTGTKKIFISNKKSFYFSKYSICLLVLHTSLKAFKFVENSDLHISCNVQVIRTYIEKVI